MNRSRIDPETLASLLDGRLDERRRAEVLERLALAEDDLEAYADAVAVTHELEAEDEAAGIVPLRPRQPAERRRPPWRWLAVAAVLALLVLVPWAWLRTGAPAGPADPGIYVALLTEPEAGLPEQWQLRPWGATRSAADPLTREARAVRLGARLVNLEIAAAAADPRATPLAAEIAVLLQGIPGSAPLVALYREVERSITTDPVGVPELLEQGRTATAELAGAEWVELGAWAEAARLAAARQDAAFFRARESRELLARAERIDTLEPSTRALLDNIRPATAAGAPMDWTALERDLAALLGRVGD